MKKIKDLKMGDMVIKDDGDLGFSMYNRMRLTPDGKPTRLTFLNHKGERALMRWIAEKLENELYDEARTNKAVEVESMIVKMVRED